MSNVNIYFFCALSAESGELNSVVKPAKRLSTSFAPCGVAISVVVVVVVLFAVAALLYFVFFYF